MTGAGAEHEISKHARATGDAGCGTPDGEDVASALQRVGLSGVRTQLVSRRLAALSTDLLPCVVMLAGGKAVAVGRVLAENRLEIATATGPVAVTVAALEGRYAGSVIAALDEKQAARGPGDVTASSEEPLPPVTLWTIFEATLKAPQRVEIVLAACLSNLFILALPLFSMAVYDRIIPHKAYETLWALAIGILIVLAVDFTARILRAEIQEAVAQKLARSLQLRLFGRVLAAEPDHAPKSASAMTTALGTIDSACHLMPAVVVGLLVDVPFVVFLLVYIGLTAHWAVAVTIACVAVIVAASAVLHAVARKAHAESSRQSVALNALGEECVGGFSVLKVTNARAATFKTVARLIQKTHEAGHTTRIAASTSGLISGTVIQLNTVLVLVVGVYGVTGGSMTAGALIAAVMLSSRAISPLVTLVSAAVRLASLAEPLRLVATFATVPVETQGDASRTMGRVSGRIDVSGVTFRYGEAATPALSDIALSIGAGERVGVVGSIGSGKSTLLKLLLRLHGPDTGGVLLDGHDLRQYDPEMLRRQIAYMPQDCDLFDTSIRENIIRGLSLVDEAAFDTAVHVAGVRDIVMRHPSGYDLQVGKLGRRLSGGERQAVCLARALVRPSPVLALDEPTSAMDAQLEQRVIARLAAVIAGRTFIVATHRAPLLALVDRVIWFDRGRIIADGPPAEVIARAAKAG